MRNFFPQWYSSADKLSAASQTTITVPPTQLRINNSSLEIFSNKILNVNSDSSWDFGQNISTWQPNTEYQVGDWVRPTGDGAYNASTDYFVPIMTGDVTDTLQASASSVFSAPSYSPYKLFDRNLGSRWSSASWRAEWWVKIDLGMRAVFNKFRYLAFSTATSPKRWSLQGSNDNANWQMLMDNTQQDVAVPTDGTWSNYFTFLNFTPYRYYLFTMLNVDNVSSLTFHELHFVASRCVFKCTSAGTSYSSEPQWPGTESSTVAESGGPTWTAYYDYKQPSNRAGKDFYVYSCIPSSGSTPKYLFSANSTYPYGYDALTSRKVGGFHALCANVGTISNHPLTGFIAGDILPSSVWCLKHRAANGNNAGLIYDENDQLWKFIYLPSLSGSTVVSVYGATILDNITWFVAVDYGAASGVRLLKDNEFTNLANGSPEGVNIYNSADPVTTGGHIDINSVRLISYIGGEDCVGIQQVWLDEQSYFYDTNSNWTWKNQTIGRGQLHVQGTYGTCKLVGFGGWSSNTRCGSLARACNLHPWYADNTISARYCVSSLEK